MSVAESASAGRWMIVEVVPSGPAAAAGIVTGDVLRGVNGRTLASADDVSEAITAITVGQQVRLSVARAERVSDVEVVAMPRPTASAPAFSGPSATGLPAGTTVPMTAVTTPPSSGLPAGRGWQPATESPPAVAASAPNGAATVSVLTNPPPASAAVAIAQAPASPAPFSLAPFSLAPVSPAPVSRSPASATPPRGRTALGVRTVPIDRDIQERFRLPQQAGAYVIGVVGELPASKAGIPPGSVIVALADRPVRSPQELTQLVAAGPTDRPVPLRYVLPGGAEKRADVVLQSLERPLEQALIGEPALQPSSAPVLQQSPEARTSQRPESPSAADANDIRREVSRVRALLESLERRLERIGR
jgi:S1-C subfamily serine protease